MNVVAFVLAIQTAQAASGAVYEGRGAPDVNIPRIEAAAIVDGVLDESMWTQAARLVGFHQYEPVDGRPADDGTEVRVWYAPDAIWFGIVASDRSPSTVRATTAERDRIDGEDHVTLYLDTFDDRRRAYFFAVNALGVQQDGVRTEGAVSAGRMFGGNTDKNPDFFFESRGRLTAEGYVVEVRVPFESLRYSARPATRPASTSA
ncbi:MAG: carbohydrate binding family 9 domain-containing protein [Longimicrobiales bacterium]